ncbi:MAG: hypothetical protein QOJ51_2496, partial [Acidobacteriaceae bacterium]|nr:hypothetical protein [Acidobacteriaceae bacterium]
YVPDETFADRRSSHDIPPIRVGEGIVALLGTPGRRHLVHWRGRELCSVQGRIGGAGCVLCHRAGRNNGLGLLGCLRLARVFVRASRLTQVDPLDVFFLFDGVSCNRCGSAHHWLTTNQLKMRI